MRSPHELLFDRTRLRRSHAVFPLTGYPPSRIPAWNGVEVRILAAPAIGAEFAQYHVAAAAGGAISPPGVSGEEWFWYVLSGGARLTVAGQDHDLAAAGYCYLPPAAGWRLQTAAPAVLLGLKKLYQAAPGISPPPALVGNANKVAAVAFHGDNGALLQTLLPDELPFDLAMNIFEFQPGRGLPMIETHVMEHGLYFLQGKGMYYLDGEWLETQADDFIWMAPFCPQSFYATGQAPAKYLYYKNVNRDIAL